MENYSLSDIAAASRDGDGAFSGNGLWIFALLLLLFGSSGGGFFGGRANAGDYGQFATAASQQEILFGQQFQGLDNKIDRIGNGIADATYALSQQLNGVQSNLGAAVNSEGRALQTQLANCCCENQRNTDSVRYDMANFAAQINSNIDTKFAAIEKSQLEQRISEQANQINQLQTQQMLCGIPKISTYAWGVYPYATNAGCGGYNNI